MIAVGSVTFELSLLTWHLVEKPFLSLKKYFQLGFDQTGLRKELIPEEEPHNNVRLKYTFVNENIAT